MKLNEPLKIKEKKLPFFSWILFNPKAFSIVFIMSIGVGLLISLGMTFIAWYYSWDSEISLVISIIAAFNLYYTIKQIKNFKYSSVSINDMVYSGKYMPKKVKKGGK